MAKNVKNLDPNGARILTDLGVVVESGEWAEVPDEVAESLAQQSVWEIVNQDGTPAKAAGEPEPRNTRTTKKAQEAK